MRSEDSLFDLSEAMKLLLEVVELRQRALTSQHFCSSVDTGGLPRILMNVGKFEGTIAQYIIHLVHLNFTRLDRKSH